MATRTNVQANQASVTSIKPTITPSSPSTQSNLTLPSEFPAHLLLRICDAILEPLLSYNSPLKPHTKPWGRTTTASTWFGSRDKFGSASNVSPSKSVTIPSSKGVPITGCKSDLLAWSYCNRRLWQICGERVFRHIKVSSLNIADILVSRRNHLRNTLALEFYINRDPEPSQAQTDLNLSRFFIQVGVIILWSPRLQFLLLDIRSLPSDRHIWDSFLSRLRQRLFISSDMVASRSGIASPDVNRRSMYEVVEVPLPLSSPDNTISGFGDEQSTMINSSARWGDSQGVISSPERVSVPHLAIGLGYNTAGALGAAEDGSTSRDEGGGFAKMLDQLLSFPRKQVLPPGAPSRWAPISNFHGLTFLDLLLPRPSWGHEEAEGYALGMVLRRLTGLRRLCLHADGGSAGAGGSGNNDFGLMRKPPYGTHMTDGDDIDSDSSVGELDMVVSEGGAVIYPTHGRTSIVSTTSQRSNAPSSTGGVFITGGAQEHRHRGYGAETWWAGVLCALSGSDERSRPVHSLKKKQQPPTNEEEGDAEGEDGEDEDEPSAEIIPSEGDETPGIEIHDPISTPIPPIQELRISVSIPGHVQAQDFDAFYHLILPHLQAFSKLETLIFDMAFAVIPSESAFSGSSYNTVEVRHGNVERYSNPARYASPIGKYTANDRFLWREQESKANWLMELPPTGDLKRLLRRQRYYVEQLIEPIVPTAEGSPTAIKWKPGEIRHGHIHGLEMKSHHAGKNREPAQPHKRHTEPDYSNISPEELSEFQHMALTTAQGVKIRTAPALRHVYFGEYHGLPPLPPPDADKSGQGRMNRADSNVFIDVGDSSNASSTSSSGTVVVANTSAGAGASASGGSSAGSGVGVGRGGSGTSIRPTGGKDGAGGTRAPERSVAENQRVVPGMWWTIRHSGSYQESVEGGNINGGDLVAQGWEELVD